LGIPAKPVLFSCSFQLDTFKSFVNARQTEKMSWRNTERIDSSCLEVPKKTKRKESREYSEYFGEKKGSNRIFYNVIIPAAALCIGKQFCLP